MRPKIIRSSKTDVMSYQSVVHAKVGGIVAVRPGSTLILRCRSAGTPQPTVVWRKNNVRLTLAVSEISFKRIFHCILLIHFQLVENKLIEIAKCKQSQFLL